MHQGLANPWLKIPQSAPFVLPDDSAAISRYNQFARREHFIDTSLIPEPLLGRHEAPVVLLGLNPGWSPDDAIWHSNESFMGLSLANLRQSLTSYHFYLLDPSIEQAPGARWWRSRLRQLIEHVGSLESVAAGLLCIEFFPYHTDRFSNAIPALPSQQFGFALVRRAIERGSMIVILRSTKLWIEAVPELATYTRKFTVRNPQHVSISPRNLPDGFLEIVRAIKNG